MSTHEGFRATARELGVSDDSVTQILQYLHPSYDLDWRPEGEPVGWSGGLPELPSDITWDGSGTFAASIDLGALPRHSLDTGLPRDGRLLLFAEKSSELGSLDYESGPSAFPRALYLPPGTETTPWDPASGEYYDEGEAGTRGPLYARATWDLDINDESDALREAMEEYRSLAGHLDPLVISEGLCLTLGGTAKPQQSPVEEELIDIIEQRKANRAEEGEGPHPREYELSLSSREEEEAAWKPLAQGNQSGIFYTGDGALYWLTPRADLSLARFDRTELVYQC
ncbi:DUF1963 domain-containing protein [Streptomyces hirsutus]|uniref:DUF1963 domain-containing protein n=1 Tax=Streptomyces hirsutus TaxID=35620 RepID=UPI0033FE440F